MAFSETVYCHIRQTWVPPGCRGVEEGLLHRAGGRALRDLLAIQTLHQVREVLRVAGRRGEGEGGREGGGRREEGGREELRGRRGGGRRGEGGGRREEGEGGGGRRGEGGGRRGEGGVENEALVPRLSPHESLMWASFIRVGEA